MRLITAFPLLMLGSFMLSTNLMAANTAVKTPSPAQAAQQKRMTDCNHQASTKSLKGENRSTFMSTCLKANGTLPLKQTVNAIVRQYQTS